ncbi:hypothetical protein GcM1_164016 [Golovinomyces cichoracearum]|uniref:Uncharacterized protein n=1 Tax=Golovinomyces cichoracearum TaxID=62708 RepID=A0A420J8D3_9PEZI|nr:hypothetical protein GcM1_164016 [Golovinomyces cichoracearum]
MAFMSAKKISDHELSKKLHRDGITTVASAPFEASARAKLGALSTAGVFQLIKLDNSYQYVRLYNT